MAFNASNTFGNDSLGVLGIRGYFRPVGESDWVDLGIVANWERTDEVEELEIQGARTGLTVTHEVIPISATLGYTFDSNNPNDHAILGLHGGAELEAGGDGFSAPIGFQATTGELLWVRENAQKNKPSMILYHPSASIRGDGTAGTPGEEAAGLSFSATVTAAETFKIPASIEAGEPDAPYGYQYLFDTDDMGNALDDVSDGGYTPGS